MSEQEQMTPEQEADFRAEMASEVFDGKEPSIDPEPEQEIEMPETESPAAEPEPDPWEGVSPAVRERLEALSGKTSVIDTLEARLKQAEQRVGSLQNTFQNRAKAPKIPVRLTPEQQKKIDAFKEDFGDIYEVLDIVTAANAGNGSDFDPSEITQALRDEILKVQTATKREIETLQLRMEYPDYEETISSNDWKKWLIDQTPEVRNKINSPMAKDAIDVLSRYSRDTGQQESAADIAAKRRAKLAANTQVVNGRKAVPKKAESDMTYAEIRAQEAKRLWG